VARPGRAARIPHARGGSGERTGSFAAGIADGGQRRVSERANSTEEQELVVAWHRGGRSRKVVAATAIVLLAGGLVAGCSPPGAPLGYSGATCWQKRAYYQARNPGLKETLGSGTIHSAPCVLASYVAIEQAATEFGVRRYTDALVRIAACESLLQPGIVGREDPADVGLFQWNEKAPTYWWSTARAGFDTWQEHKASATGGAYKPRYASDNRLDPYNSARVAAWEVMTYPHAWPVTWLCKGIYDPATHRLR
jgi:hypothetical protein